MQFAGIIAEYDPFHNGHAAQLAAVRAAGAQCIAVCMSSGAVQRGGGLAQCGQERGRLYPHVGALLNLLRRGGACSFLLSESLRGRGGRPHPLTESRLRLSRPNAFRCFPQ